MRHLVFTVLFLVLACHPASADDGCDKSREYILGDAGGDLPMPSATYNQLFRICVSTTSMSNVKNAYLLKDGGIAVVPKKDSVWATAATLSQFCDAYPTATLRFLTRREQAANKSMPAIVNISSTSATSCKAIKGLS